jgi:hypothetical protein
VQNILSFSLLSKNIDTKIYVTVVLLVDLYGCETWSLTLKDKHRLRKPLGLRGMRQQGSGENYVTRCFMICTPHQVHKRFCWGNLRQRGHLENIVVNGRIILKLIFKK